MSVFAINLTTSCLKYKQNYLELGNCHLTPWDFLKGGQLDMLLKECTHLETLILSNEWWDYNKEEWVKSQYLDQKNHLTAIPPCLSYLKNLKVFICGGNSAVQWRINDVSPINGLNNLSYLDLSYNQIASLKDTDNKRLQKLYLSNNQFESLHGFGKLQSLKELDISRNRVTSLHGLENLSLLEELNANSNEIEDLTGLNNLPALKVLDFSANEIKSTRGFEELTSLTHLDISSNKLQSLCLGNLPNLNKLDASSNTIHFFEGLELLVGLTVLDLSYNELQTINGIEKIKNLRELNLIRNEIKDISYLTDLVQIQKLDVSANQLQSLEGIEKLTNLKTLNISNNYIQNLNGFENLTALQILNTDDNLIKDIRGLIPLLKFESFQQIGDKGININKIHIESNPLTTPPIEIVRRGNNAVLSYFHSIDKQGVEYLYEAKMLIVGQPRAGKTSLRYKLFNSDAILPKEEETTRGIDIERLNFEILDQLDQPRQFFYNVWDFGGQHIYQTTHQFFLTHRSLYILVLDTGKDSIGNDDSTLNYWLQALELLGGNSPLLLVRNEKNERQVTIDIPQKQARFNFLKGDYTVDLDALIVGSEKFNHNRLADFKVLKEDIETKLKRLPLIGFPMPKNWIQIRNTLQELSQVKQYISGSEYIEICVNHSVKEYERQMELSQIFHDLGVFLHFQDYTNLEDFIILQNIWATDAVFAVLDNPLVQINKGKFSDSDLSNIWKNKKYEPSVHKKLLALMMQFELCYQVDKVKPITYIIPEMLSDKPPEGYEWQPLKDLPLQYRYDFMPKGILTRLIVRLHKHIALYANQQVVWKTGVKIDGRSLDCLSTFAEITEAWDNKQLSIRIQGPFAKDLMSKITYQLDELNNEFFRQVNQNEQSQKSKWYKMIPCICKTCKETANKHYHDYRDLLERKEFGKESIECNKKPYDKVKIEDLIDGVFAKEISNNSIKKDQRGAKKIFISYSKEDLHLVTDFAEHLTALERDNVVAHWYCTELIAGKEWEDEIQRKFDDADIVCFMVSSKFMKTAYIHKHEVKRAFARKKNDKNFLIIPIILDFCKWTTKDYNLGSFTALPYTAKPVMDFKNPNKAWYIIQECIRLTIENNLNPEGDDFYVGQTLPKDVLDIYKQIVSGKATA